MVGCYTGCGAADQQCVEKRHGTACSPEMINLDIRLFSGTNQFVNTQLNYSLSL